MQDNDDKQICKVDITRPEEVQGIFDGADCVVHLAGLVDCKTQTTGEEGRTLLHKLLIANVVGTYNVLEECARAKARYCQTLHGVNGNQVKRVVLASSNHVQHGLVIQDCSDPRTIDTSLLNGALMSLNDPPVPDSFYGVTKALLLFLLD